MSELQVKRIKHEESLTVGERPITVGRSSENDIVLQSKSVSRRHCVIEIIDGATRLRDLGSRHGTTLNGKPITESTLQPGDAIVVGGYEIVFDPKTDDVRTDPGPAANGTAMHEIDQAATDLARQREELEKQARAIADRRATFEHQESVIVELRAALEQERGAVTMSREELEQERSAVTTSREELEQERSAVAAAREELEQERRTLVTAREELEQERRTVATSREELEQERRTLTTSREAHEEERRALAASRDEHEAARSRLAEEAEAFTAQIRDAADRIEELEAEVRIARETERAIGTFVQGVELLNAAARRLAANQDSVREIEAMWIEMDEQIRAVQEAHGQVHPSQLHERDQLSEHLEAAHEEGDAASAALIEIAGRLHELVIPDEPRER